MIMALSCLLAISVSAENKIIKLDTLPTLEEIHANPSAYVSRIDALESTEYKDKDPNSVLVFGDSTSTATYYYVYPAYYLLRSSGWNLYDNLSTFNSAIAGADSTAFAEYTSPGGNYGKGRCDFLYLVEVPTYVTSLNANYKFENNANIREIYFPTKTVVDDETGEEKTVTIVGISGQNTFTGCKKLVTIHNFEYLPASAFNNGAFSGCNSLVIEQVVIPKSITSIPSGIFSDCYKIKSVVFHDGITYIGSSAFYNCDSITEIILPNTVKTICKKSFASMDKLVTISFGAGLEKMDGSDGNCEILTGSALKYVYMPATFASQIVNGTSVRNGNSILSGGSKVTMFFTGTQQQAEDLRTKLTTGMTNDLIKNATFVKFDENQDYEGYADELGYTILVYDCNVCDTFYEGNHNYTGDGDCTHGVTCTQCLDNIEGFADHVYTETLVYPNGFAANGVYNKYCTNASDCAVGLVENGEKKPVFTALEDNGYSINAYGTGIAFGGFVVNTEEFKLYNDLNEDDISFGIFVANPKYVGDTFMKDGEVNATSGFLKVDMTSDEYTNIKIMLDGFTGTAQNLELVISLYAEAGEDVEYIQSEHTACANAKVTKSDATLYTVTLNSVANKPYKDNLDALPEYGKENEVA